MNMKSISYILGWILRLEGVFMALPLGTLRDLKSGEHMVTCDNCGRILYAKDE